MHYCINKVSERLSLPTFGDPFFKEKVSGFAYLYLWIDCTAVFNHIKDLDR